MARVAIIVASCDAYSDLWEPFFDIFHKQWPDCPYPVFLGTNLATFDSLRVTSIPVGEDLGWAANLLAVLNRADATHAILLLEDFFFSRRVDTKRILSLERLAVKNQVGCFRLFPHPPPSKKLRGLHGIGVMRPGDDWRVSTQAALWDVNVLRELAWPQLSAWNFEVIGSVASIELPAKFWGVYEPALEYANALVRGKWTQAGIEVCTRMGIEVDFEKRGLLAMSEDDESPPIRRLDMREMGKRLAPEFLLRFWRRFIRLRRTRQLIDELMARVEKGETLAQQRIHRDGKG